MEFDTWKEEVKNISLSEYGYNVNESQTEEELAAFYAEDETPREHVEWWVEKFNLLPYQDGM